MSRISKQAIVNTLAETAKRIESFDSNDNGKISRAEIKKGVDAMPDGVEKNLTETYAKFVDHRDHRSGAQVTKSDLDRSVEYAADKMVDRLDTNGNGLSKSELKAGSLIVQMAAQVARSKE